MSIVVLTRSIKSIDLTASLLHAYAAKKNGMEEIIEWVVEESVDEQVYIELKEIAAFFSSCLKIVVKHQSEIIELSPTNEQIVKSLLDILKEANYITGRVRIQHGAIIVKNDSEILRKYRYFGLNKNKKLMLYDNKNGDHTIEIDNINQYKLSVQGSMNLYFLYRYGKLAHLPWYCIDSNFETMVVDGIIFPPEGCLKEVFGINGKRLLPYGYSVCDYTMSSTAYVMEKWMLQSGSRIRSRGKQGTNCSQSILQWLARIIRKEIIQKGFKTSMQEISDNVELPEENIKRLLKIWCLSKIMISYDRGYGNKLKIFGLLNEDGLIYKDKKVILDELIFNLDCCYNKIYPQSVRKKDFEKLKSVQRPFGQVAKYTYEILNQFFNSVFWETFYTNKATVSNIIQAGKTVNGVFSLFDNVLDQRGTNITLKISGGIFQNE